MEEDRSALFNELQGFSQRKLKKVETKVVTGLGENVVEKRGAKGLQTVKPNEARGAANEVKKKLDLQVGMVLPGLLIAADDVATHKATLEEYGVSHILNLCSSIVDNHFEDDYNYCNLDIKDSPSVNIKEYFEECFDFIDEGRHRGNVLVHCDASVPGLSRSTAICVAYLMNKEKKKFVDAYNEVKEARAFVKPNEGFMRQLKEYENEMHGEKKQEEKQDAFTLKKRQEIEAEKEMLKNKISIKDKLKAFAPTSDQVDQQNRAISPSTPNRLQTGWMTNNVNSVDKDPSAPGTEDRPAPRKLTSILSIFQQPKDTKENQTPNQNFVKNTAPTRKWKPVEVKTLQGTKGPEAKKAFTYDKVRKSKSKEWKGREVKKTKSKGMLSKADSIQKDEPKVTPKEPMKAPPPAKDPVNFTASVTIKNPSPTPPRQPSPTQQPVVKTQLAAPAPPPPPPPPEDSTAPWRRPRDYSPGNQKSIPEPPKPPPMQQTKQQPMIVKQPSQSERQPPQTQPQPVRQQSTVTRQPSIQNQIVIETKSNGKQEPEKEEIPAQKRVFGRIPPPPMKIVGRDMSLSDERKVLPQQSAAAPQPQAPPPPPAPKVTNIKIDVEKRDVPKFEPPKSQQQQQPLKPQQQQQPPKPQQQTVKPALVKTITLEESSEEESEEEDEEDEEEEEESEEEPQDTRKNSKAGLTRSSTLEILNLIKSKTQVLEDKKFLNAVDENEEIDTLLGGLEEEGIENIDWAELGIELHEVKDIVKKNQVEESEEEDEEEEDEEEEYEVEEEEIEITCS